MRWELKKQVAEAGLLDREIFRGGRGGWWRSGRSKLEIYSGDAQHD